MKSKKILMIVLAFVMVLSVVLFTACEEEKATVSSISVSAPTKTNYVIGESVVLDGAKITVKMSDGSTNEIALGGATLPEGVTVENATCEQAGAIVVKVSYAEKSASFIITVSQAHAHTYNIFTGWKDGVKPTENAGATAIMKCGCGESSEVSVTKLTDTSVWTANTTPATHDAVGKVIYSSSYGQISVIIPQGAHSFETFDGWQDEIAPTLNTSAVAIMKCSCGATELVAVPQLADTLTWTAVKTAQETHKNVGTVVYTSNVYGSYTVEIPAIEHIFGEFDSWKDEVAPTQSEGATAIMKCSCGETTEISVPALSERTVWRVKERIAPDYNKAGSIVYNNAVYGEVTVQGEAKLSAIFNGQSYKGALVYSHNSIGSGAEMVIDKAGNAEASYYRTGAQMFIKLVDGSKPYGDVEVTFTWTDGSEEKTDVHHGYVTEDGYMFFNRNADSVRPVYLFVPTDESAVSINNFDKCYDWFNNTVGAVTFTYGSKVYNWYIQDDVMFFNVSFEDINGNAISAATISKRNSSDEIVANVPFVSIKDSDGKVIKNFVKDGEALVETDGYEGVFTSGASTLTVWGNGKFDLDAKSGVYSFNSGKFECYVMDGETKVEYLEITTDGSAFTCVKPMVTVAFEQGIYGTAISPISVNANIPMDLPTTEYALSGEVTHKFVGWCTDSAYENLISGQFIPTANTTLYAKWAERLVITISGAKRGDAKLIHVGEGDVVVNMLPAYTFETLNDAGTKFFRGWFVNLGTEYEEMLTAENSIVDEYTEPYTVSAKWIDKVEVTFDYAGNMDNQVVAMAKGDKLGDVIPSNVTAQQIVGFAVFEGWTLNQGGTIIEDASQIEVNENMTVYSIWSDAGVWTVEQGNYTFVYNAEGNYWKSNNYHVKSSTASIRIIPQGGPIEVSFNYWGDGEGSSDYFTIYYMKLNASGGTTSNSTKITSAVLESNATPYTFKLLEGENLYITYYKDSSVDTEPDAAFLGNLTINGFHITNLLTPDRKEGTYTCASQPDLVLDGFAGFVWGDKSGSYTVAAEDAGYTIYAKTETETYKITLDGTTYSAEADTSVITFVNEAKAVAPATVFNNIAYTLPSGEAVEVAGKFFMGWFDNEGLTGSAITTITPTANATYYAKYLDSVDVTFNYSGAQADEIVTIAKGEKIGDLLKTVEFKFGTKVFVAWFSKDGTGDDWGTEITANSTFTIDSTVYAQWIEPHPLMGNYSVGANKDPSESSVAWEADNLSSSTYHIVVDAFGKVTGWKNGTINYDSETGLANINVSGSVCYGGANAEYGVVCFEYNAGKTTPFHDTVLMVANNKSGATPTKADSFSWNKGITKLIRIDYNDGSFIYVFIKDRVIYADVSWTATDSKGAALTAWESGTPAKIQTITISDKSGAALFTFAKSGSDLLPLDGLQGTYTCGGDTIVLNGVGGISGAISGSYTIAAQDAGYSIYVTTTTATYKITLDGANYTSQADTSVITFVIPDGVLKTVDPVTVATNISYTLPAANTMTAEGYVFRGWYTSSTLTGSTVTKVTPTGDMNVYAKYDPQVTVTYNYNGQGTPDATITLGAGDKIGTLKTVTATFGDKVFAGWFTKNGTDDDWGTEVTSSMVVNESITIYAKWQEPSIFMGKYMRYELDNGTFRTYGTATTVDALGICKEGTSSTQITFVDYNETTHTFTFKSGTTNYYGYFDATAKAFARSYSSNASSLGTDTYVYIPYTSSVSPTASDYLYSSDKTTRLAGFTVDGKFYVVLIHNGMFYANVSVEIAGTPATSFASIKSASSIAIKDASGNFVCEFAVSGSTLLPLDGWQGTYTGSMGEMVLDGAGNVTVGGSSTTYVISEGKIIFTTANTMHVASLDKGASTYAFVQDGYQGTYTLPTSGTITLDGFGGAGDGKTYVVSGTIVNIYTGDSSEMYGIDVENKIFKGQSPVAGKSFSESSSSLKLNATFELGPQIVGTFKTTSYPSYVYGIEGTIDGNTITFTVTSQNYSMGHIGKKFVATLSGNTLTIISSEFRPDTSNNNGTNIVGLVLTCA